jgi:hypothetical protein
MAFGDIGGPVTELVITCKTPAEGPVYIEKGDAVALVGNYTVCNSVSDPVFGQAISANDKNSAATPIRVKGVNVYRYIGEPPFGEFYAYLHGIGVVVSNEVAGAVEFSEKGTGKILAFDLDSKTVHVLH